MWPFWDGGILSFLLPTLIAVLFFILSINLFKYFTMDLHVPIRDSKTHSWKRTVELSGHCSLCEALLIGIDAFFCDSCGMCADPACLKIADKTHKCKAIAISDSGPMKHHWIKGSLQVSSSCDVCEEESGLDSASTDLKCCWCHRSVHEICQPKLGEICDFGTFRSLIVPPSCVQLGSRIRVSHKQRISSVTSPPWPDWTPLIVIANRKSGNKDGGKILSCFRHLLNPVQVIDLSERPPEAALEWCQLLSPVVPKILVGGGDGTIGWVLSTVHKMKLDPVPPVGIIPLGTGNDLSRVLGWGTAYCSSTTGSDIMSMVQRAKVVNLDRWQVDISLPRPIPFLSPQQRTLNMYNYVSIGVDAQVTLDFHRTRESAFYIFSSRIFNKILYVCFGTQQVVERECQGLENKLEVFLDGEQVELPEIESVVVVNIPSWGAGVDLWPMCSLEGDERQSISDGKLEVVAIYSSFHIAQLQVGLSQPYRLGQASHVKIRLKQKSAMQVDGEPWLQQPGEINVSYVNHALVLRSSS